ncbi:urease accessory protein UreD [Euhalothece natronophila Z-M001]|uniref:Urease accessory protein UreD n=1 Tax=Euhalothece natronophila Z-M001 TaxID=522448 RepID=A0A5B8NRM1_9CHRO|nr:urease accessory protein UreD [Euhalothece natronophila]QDZ41151.1 urease accessory protein UreD [Euhalothece natronophila Z-M001]
MLETSSSWCGWVKLTYQFCNDRTKPVATYAQAPYKLQRPFYPQTKTICYTTILHTAGGMVGGDQLSQSIQLQPKTHAVITTAAASKVYRSNGLNVTQQAEIDIDQDACLEYLPRETILFEGAQSRQKIQVNLGTNASYLGWDILRFGRSARGEKFLRGEWRSRTEIWQNQQLIWVDSPYLPASPEIWNSPHGLAGYPLVGTLVWVGKPVSEEMIAQVRNLWQEMETTGEAGTTQLTSGLLCRYRGNSRAEVINWFINIWRLIRQWNGQVAPVTPRVWQV